MHINDVVMTIVAVVAAYFPRRAAGVDPIVASRYAADLTRAAQFSSAILLTTSIAWSAVLDDPCSVST